MPIWRRLLVAASVALLVPGLTTTKAVATEAPHIVWKIPLQQGIHDSITGRTPLRLTLQTPAPPRSLDGFERSGTYLSPIYTSPEPIASVRVVFAADVPIGSQLQVAVRAAPADADWQPWQAVPESGTALDLTGGPGRFQVRVLFAGSAKVSPALRSLRVELTSGSVPVALNAQQTPAASVAPTYRIFATREGLVGHRTANGHIIQPRDHFVALPSWAALATNGGHEYTVRITYRGRSAVVPVWDVGPWNSHDDYWGPVRTSYADLPVGLPMAQAAYEQGYNGGRDEYGRRVGLPNGIDIADGTYWDELGMTGDDWVEVSFLWLGADPGPSVAQAPHENPAIADAAAVADDGGSGYTATPAEGWYLTSCGLGGSSSWAYSAASEETATHQASWAASVEPSFYEVLAYIPFCAPSGSDRAIYRVGHDGGVSEVIVNQQANAGSWASLGIYHLGDPGSATVTLRDLNGSDTDVLHFDAVKWVRRSDKQAPQSSVRRILAQQDGSFVVQWNGSDDVSGVAAFDLQWRVEPNGAWVNWHTNDTRTEDRFYPQTPGAIAFRVRARDWAGHVEDWPTEPDANTSQAESEH